MVRGQSPFRARPGLSITYDGQSFNYAPVPPDRGVAMLVQDRMAEHQAGAFVVGISGTTYAQRNTTRVYRSFSTLQQFTEPVLCDIGGQSDLLAGMSAAAILAAMEEYHNAARAAGALWTVCATVPPISAAWGATDNAQRLALNDSIRQSGYWQGVADIAAIPEAQDPLNPVYFSDGLHPTQALADLWADLIEAAIRRAVPGI